LEFQFVLVGFWILLDSNLYCNIHDILPCFPKRFDLSQIITPIIDNRHLIVQNSSIITYFFISISKINERSSKYRLWYFNKKSFISLCIIETIRAIFREYKLWIVLLITQWSKSSKILALFLGLFDLQGLLPFIIRCTEVYDTPKALDVLWYTLSNETIGFFVAFSLLKKANNFFTNFWHSGDKSDFLPILQKMQNITIIYERNACQFRLKYTWLRERFYR
jgi:hypothetical protein